MTTGQALSNTLSMRLEMNRWLRSGLQWSSNNHTCCLQAKHHLLGSEFIASAPDIIFKILNLNPLNNER